MLSRRKFMVSAGALTLSGGCATRLPTTADKGGCMPAWATSLGYEMDEMAESLLNNIVPWRGPGAIFDVRDFGATSNGQAVCTVAIQNAIDAAAEQGGGTVLLTKGEYVSGTLDMRSNVRLKIASSARLLGSTDLADYPERVASRPTVMDSNMGMNQSLIFAEDCENIAITGPGTIDGRGTQENFPGEQTQGATPGRPFLIRILDCRWVHVSDVRLINAACWMQNYLNCDHLLLEDLHVENQVNHNNDGIDVDGCRKVVIRRCFVNAEDDAMCFKGASQRPTQDVLVEDCRFYSNCNALKFGTDSQGDFRRVLVRRCELGGVPEHLPAKRRKRSDSGISWEIVDGGTLEDVVARDIAVNDSLSPLFIRLGDRGRVRPEDPRPEPGILRRVVFERIHGTDNGPRGSYFVGIPDRFIEDIALRDVRLMMDAAHIETAPNEASYPEKREWYPDAHMYGELVPAYGLWARHVRRLSLCDVEFIPVGQDPRPKCLLPRTERHGSCR